MNASTPATRTNVEIRKFKDGADLERFVFARSRNAENDEIAHRCNVHDDLMIALEAALAYLTDAEDHDDIAEVTAAVEDALKLIGRAEASEAEATND